MVLLLVQSNLQSAWILKNYIKIQIDINIVVFIPRCDFKSGIKFEARTC